MKSNRDAVCADPTVAPDIDKKLSWPISACFSVQTMHPMQLLQERACVLSGVSRKQATLIDDLNIGEKIGEYNMMQLAESFQRRVLNDKDPWFRNMFGGKEDYAQNLNEYILQRLGGPSYYSDRKGNPGLIAKHADFECSSRTAERWLEYMDETLEEEQTKNGTISSKQREMIMLHFRWQAYVLVASQEAAREVSTDGGPRPPNLDNPPPLLCPIPTFARSELDPSNADYHRNVDITEEVERIEPELEIEENEDED